MEKNIETEPNNTPAQGGLTDGVQAPAEENGEEQEVPSNVGNQTNMQPNAGAIEAPETLTNKELWDKAKGALITDKVIEELNKQTKRADDLRQKLSKGINTPKEAAGYEFNPSETVAPLMDKDQKYMNEIKAIAHKNNLSQEQFNGFINDYMQMALDKGLLQKPMTEEEAKAAKEKYVEDQKKKLGVKADELIQGAVAFIETQYNKGIFNEAEKEALRNFADSSAEGISIVNKLREMSGQPFIPTQNAQTDGIPTDREIITNWGKYSDSEKISLLEQRQKAGRPAKFLE